MRTELTKDFSKNSKKKFKSPVEGSTAKWSTKFVHLKVQGEAEESASFIPSPILPCKRHRTLLRMEFYPCFSLQTPFMWAHERAPLSPPFEFMATVQRLRLCYVSAETARPMCADPSPPPHPLLVLSPDKKDNSPRGPPPPAPRKSTLYFLRWLWKSSLCLFLSLLLGIHPLTERFSKREGDVAIEHFKPPHPPAHQTCWGASTSSGSFSGQTWTVWKCLPNNDPLTGCTCEQVQAEISSSPNMYWTTHLGRDD